MRSQRMPPPFLAVLTTALLTIAGGSSSSLASSSSAASSSSVSSPPPATAHYTAFDDTSWAVNEPEVRSAQILGSSRQRDLYGEFLSGCARASSAERCVEQDNWRMQMNMYQPRSVVNYTKTGFLKVRAPDSLHRQLVAFWEENRHEAVDEEGWPGWDSAHHNSWTAPARVVRIENDTLPGGGYALASRIAGAIRPMMEEWTGMRLVTASAARGIRLHRDGSLVAPHVDPLPLVASAFVHVAQEGVREPWPLEVYDHDGVAHNVTTVPGDVVFYEGHSAIHGRPFPLSGSCFASVVVHFEPVAPLQSVGAELVDRHYPPYLLRGSSWEYEWRDEHPGGWELFRHPWELAERGDLEGLRLAAVVDAGLLSRPNPETGWEPLLYACLRGHLEAAAFLVGEGGADANAAYPGCPHFLSALHASNLKWGEDSAISRFLVSQGAVVDPLRQFNQSAPAEEDLYGL